MKLCNFNIGLNEPLFLISGPCVIESEELVLETAGKLKEITQKLGMNFIFKTSFDKANRTSHKSFRGLGMERGLEILAKVKKHIQVPILTDIHEDTPIDEVASIVDVYKPQRFYVARRISLKKFVKPVTS